MNPRRRTLRLLLGIALLLAVMIGFAGSLGRGTAVYSNPGHDPDDGTLTGYDSMAVEFTVALLGIERSSERYQAYRADIAAFSRTYYRYRPATYLHVLPAALVLLLIPVQFVGRLRRGYPALHRWVGRTILIACVPLVVSGLFFGAVPFAGSAETAATWLFGIWFVVTAGRGLAAIRAGDRPRHREWMLRAVAVLVGIVTIRLVDLALIGLWELPSRPAFAISIWTGWALTVGATELWIRHTRDAPPISAGLPAVSR